MHGGRCSIGGPVLCLVAGPLALDLGWHALPTTLPCDRAESLPAPLRPSPRATPARCRYGAAGTLPAQWETYAQYWKDGAMKPNVHDVTFAAIPMKKARAARLW